MRASFNILSLKSFISLVTIVFSLLFTACQSNKTLTINSQALFHDELYSHYKKIQIESEADVFDLGDAAKIFVDEIVNKGATPEKQIIALSKGIFDHSSLNLLYQNDANTIASVTFANREANCLSLVIMTYAMAEHANLGVRFQQVNIPELWVRRKGNSLLNKHVNLRLFRKPNDSIILFNNESFQLDFDNRAQSLRMPVNEISKKFVLAMFYNNKGAEALINGDKTKAYAYFRAALTTESTLQDAWTNLGILYRRDNHLDYAERAYKQALFIDPSNATTLENLSYIYSLTKRKGQAKEIMADLKRQRKKNPFYHYMLGQVAYENQLWNEAINYYKEAINLDKKQHYFYFSLSNAYYKIGSMRQAEVNLRLAKRYAREGETKTMYQEKIEFLHQQN